METPHSTTPCNKYLCSLIFLFSIVLYLVFSLPHTSYLPFWTTKVEIDSESPARATDPCISRYIYAYDLPEKFNADILLDCRNFYPWTDMCPVIVNSGLGPKINNTDGVLQETGWYRTDQWILGILFHNRMKEYKCLTTNYSMARAIYIPYYAGFDVTRYLWDKPAENPRIDKLGLELVDWLKERPEWVARGGRDHFIVSGRTTWDMQREPGTTWGSILLRIPETKNITVLAIERRTWENNEHSIPYPTYFHPFKLRQVVTWQQKVRSAERPSLFSFAGAPRPNAPHMVRNHLIDQCSQSSKCKLHECYTGGHDCNSPGSLINFFMQSKFCLQPPGDTFTRRSTFDSILAGCIPVFFHDDSARLQYNWHMPKIFESFAVFIPEDAVKAAEVRVEDVLLAYSDEQIEKMTEEVVNMIPRIIYKHPRYKSDDFRDAFDIAVDGVLEKLREIY